MKRRWHVLKGNKGCETVQNAIYFDTETKPTVLPDGSERDRLWFGWMTAKSRTSQGKWGRETWTRFRTVDAFWRQIDASVRDKSKWFIFCHNTSFDLPIVNVFNKGAEYGWTLKAAVIEAPPTIITLRRGTITLVFVDTLNWWRMPLAKIGKQVGLPKLDMPSPTADKATWDVYGKRDTEILVKVVEQWLAFLVEHDLGGFASTLASQAFRTYRHRFMPCEIVIDADEKTNAISREAYHGGRVECFKLGRQEGPIYGYDINSMYPSVMLTGFFPSKLLGFYPTQDRSRWKRLTEDYCIVARCTVNPALPFLPFHSKHGLAFPTGTFETTLTTPEIALAIRNHCLIDMRDVVVYERANLFREFITFIWKQRRAAQRRGDTVGDWLWKILANSLYGKFGQTGLVYETSEQIEDLRALKYEIYDYDSGEMMKARQLGGLLQVMSKEGEARDSFPAIAAHVTAQARVLLWRLALKAGIPNLLYSDTDSLYVTEAGSKGLAREVAPTRIGKLKLVGTYEWMDIRGLKDYAYPGHNVIKGVRANAIEIKPGVYEQLQWSSLKGLLGKGDMTAPTRKTIRKTLKREYKKPRTV